MWMKVKFENAEPKKKPTPSTWITNKHIRFLSSQPILFTLRVELLGRRMSAFPSLLLLYCIVQQQQLSHGPYIIISLFLCAEICYLPLFESAWAREFRSVGHSRPNIHIYSISTSSKRSFCSLWLRLIWIFCRISVFFFSVRRGSIHFFFVSRSGRSNEIIFLLFLVQERKKNASKCNIINFSAMNFYFS